MPDNIQQVDLPQNTWIDLYASTGLTVGTQINVENVGSADVNLSVQATQPDNDDKDFNILKRPPSVNMQNSSGDSGAWAYSSNTNGRLSIASSSKNGFTPTTDVRLLDSSGFPLESFVDVFTGDRTLSVYTADLNYRLVNRFFYQDTAITTTLTVPVVGDGTEQSVTVADGTGFAVGDALNIGEGTSTQEPTLHVILVIVGVVPALFTLDRRLHQPHSVGVTVTKSITNMALNSATLSVPQLFTVKPPPGQLWHIHRILFEMTHAAGGDLGRFGDILNGVTNGVCLRARASGQFGAVTNWKTNSDIKVDMFDIDFDARSGGQGAFGTSGRATFENAGIVVRLNGDANDQFEAIIQDDLTSLGSFRIKAQGKIAVL